MDPRALEWIHAILRWTHVIAAIAWIGHAFLFNELERALVPPQGDDPDKDKLDGELWMVHGGGFFKLQKTFNYPSRLNGALHWFKWEAAFTWISGFVLLSWVYYHGGGIYLLNPSHDMLTYWPAVGVGVGSMFFGWIIYDVLCRSPLGKVPAVFAAVLFGLFTAAAFGLTKLLSARAGYIHVGAMIGTIMAANVWMIIIPSMKRMIAGVAPGERLDLAMGKRAKQRSLHNNYFVFPLIFIMISNHFPGAYGHPRAWAVLAGISLVGVLVKHAMNKRGEIMGIYLALALSVAGAVGFQVLGSGAGPEDEPGPAVIGGADGEATAIDASAVGTIRGVVEFVGTAPPRKRLALRDGCEHGHDGPVFDDTVLVKDGRLQNAFVWIKKGYESYEIHVPKSEVLIDQRGCIYEPRVSGAMQGQKVVFLNSDNLPHNVHLLAENNPGLNELMPGKDQRLPRRFKKPEVMIEAKCDIHPWMRAYFGIVPHPWFAVTGPDGAFVLNDVPPGEYVLETWHEVYGRVTQKVTVPPRGEATARFRYQAP